MKYNIIYADPPWQYRQRKGNGVAENHYQTMNLKDICNLPIDTISHKDSVLFLWTTFPMLQEALQVIIAWGYTFKTVAFVWVKQNKSENGFFFGLGHWTRSNAEICLLAVKGRPKRISKKVHQLIVSPVEGHSKKPDIARDKIVELMGDLPRVELFARQSPVDWDVWGNEVESSISLETKKQDPTLKIDCL
ncbi:MT-A70 family methyltransferase [Oceanobacillus sp. FSL K6-2867]|uniref:MT-A70 family methyltransferase n=1 Tax=Oceanobacillus sp. FSL K6-2867 TaxID=2954748 RepID=UPI0030D883BD